MNVKNREQLLTIAVIALVVLFASDKLIFSPLGRAWKTRSEKIVTLKKNLTQGASMMERERSIRDRWSAMRTNTLPSNLSTAESTVLRAFDRWSQESKISISSIKPEWKHDDEDYMTLQCRADTLGSIQAVTRFLYEIEKDPLALKVESVEITSRDNDGKQLSMAVMVSGLLLNPPEQ